VSRETVRGRETGSDRIGLHKGRGGDDQRLPSPKSPFQFPSRGIVVLVP